MDEARETVGVLVDSPHRLAILETLEDGPVSVGELSDALDLPRATAKHNLTRLAEADLVTSEGSRYEITTFGTHVRSQLQDCLEGVGATRRLLPFLELVDPSTFDADPAAFADARVTEVTSATPHAPVERLAELVADATYVRAVTPVVLPTVGERLHEQLLEGDLRVDLLIPTDALQAVRERFGDDAERAIENGRLLVGQYPETPPFGLFLFEDRLALAGHDEENLLRCLVETGDDRALGWARETFADYERGVETYLHEAPTS